MVAFLAAMLIQSSSPSDLLDRMVGRWVMRGTIGKTQTVHDLDAKWVLNKEYVQIHEVSREKGPGDRKYEAIIYVGCDPKAAEYAGLWMDNTAYGGFSPEGTGHGKAAGDSIPVLFGTMDNGVLTTFAYDRAKDAWSWTIDNEIKGQASPFARLVLTRK
jgi:hypothetical protein